MNDSTVTNSNGSATIKLRKPLSINGVETPEITLRRPAVFDLERMDKVKGDMSKGIVIAAQLADLAPDDIRQLDAADFKAVSEVIADFLD